MLSHDSLPTSYRVEISGWDQDENFFVEKTFLDWSEEKGKKVQLRRPLRSGAVIFVRLLAPATANSGVPIAYQTEELEQQGPKDLWDFRLVQLHPRAASQPQDSQAAVTVEK
jgi:hypothetical protein